MTLTLIAKVTLAQVKAPLAIKEYERGLNPVDEITLFDLSEIKHRNIDTAYIIYHPGSWAESYPGLTLVLVLTATHLNCIYSTRKVVLYRQPPFNN